MYDYLIVGSGLFGATFAYLARQAGKSCLVSTSAVISEEMGIVRILRVSMFTNMVLISSIQKIGKCGIS